MTKKEDFKNFAKLHPELVSYVKSGEASWQKFYEIYDIYGEDRSAWSNYLVNNNRINNDYSLKSITDKIKNIDFNSIQEHIKTAQKALGVVQELTEKTVTPEKEVSTVSPRPINKIFED